MLTAQDIKGASKKYDSLPSSEKESIDRQFNEITKDVEAHSESNKKSAWRDCQEAMKDVSGYAYRHIVNGGVWSVPSRQGGNEFMEEPISEEEQKLERLVRKIIYELKVEDAVEYLKGKVDLTKI